MAVCSSRESVDKESNLSSSLKAEMMISHKLRRWTNDSIKAWTPTETYGFDSGPEKDERSILWKWNIFQTYEKFYMKSSELSPYQVVMIGIKKDVSVG